jgi:hypothetical protein
MNSVTWRRGIAPRCAFRQAQSWHTLAHKEAAKGFSYKHSDLKTQQLHRLQHKKRDGELTNAISD